MRQKVVIVSGYFNPIHKGHIEYFNKAKLSGNLLFVIVNNDFQRSLKKSKEFQSESERVLIVENLKMVDKCFLSIDKDRTVIETIKFIYNNFNDNHDLFFAMILYQSEKFVKN
jgi:cytidyltransferase-like protein